MASSLSGNYPKQWQQGVVVEVPLKTDPLRGITAPAWDELDCEIPQRLSDAPDNVVAESVG